MNPLDQLPKERPRAYAAFRAFIEMGDDRSVRGLARLKPEYARNTLRTWETRYRWRERIREHDEHLTALAMAEREKAIRAQARQWADRRKEAGEKEWALAEALQSRAEQMLKMPLVRQVVKKEVGEVMGPDGQPLKDAEGKPIKGIVATTTVEAVRWSQDTASRMIEVATKLRRLATGQATDQVEHTGPGGGPVLVEHSEAEVDLHRAAQVMAEQILNERGQFIPIAGTAPARN